MWTPIYQGFPSGSVVKNLSAVQEFQEIGFSPWVGNIPWKRVWQPTIVFLPGKSDGQRSLMGYSPQGRKELDTNEVTQHTHPHPYTHHLASAVKFSYINYAALHLFLYLSVNPCLFILFKAFHSELWISKHFSMHIINQNSVLFTDFLFR